MTNQQKDCAPSEYSNQPGHLPSLIGVFAVRMKKAQVLSYPLSAQRRLIRLGGCLLAQRSVSSANGSFVLLNFKSLRATGWLKNAKIASFTTDNVSFI